MAAAFPRGHTCALQASGSAFHKNVQLAWGGEDDAYIFEFMTDFELTNTDSSISTWDLKLHSYYIENEVAEG